MTIVNTRHEISYECACGHIQHADAGGSELSVYCSECGSFIARYTPRASSPKPQAPSPKPQALSPRPQTSSATDGSATEHGCSPAGSRIDAPPAAVRGDSQVSNLNLSARETARAEFHRAADAALDALTNLHAVINRHRSRLTINEVATVKQQLHLIHHTIKLWGLLGAARPDDLPGSLPQASGLGSQVSLPQKGWAGR